MNELKKPNYDEMLQAALTKAINDKLPNMFDMIHMRKHYDSIKDLPEYESSKEEFNRRIVEIDTKLEDFSKNPPKLSDEEIATITTTVTAMFEADMSAFKSQLIENLTVFVDGIEFNADEKSQTRMIRAAASLSKNTDTVKWKTADEMILDITKLQLTKAATAAADAQAKIFKELEI